MGEFLCRALAGGVSGCLKRGQFNISLHEEWQPENAAGRFSGCLFGMDVVGARWVIKHGFLGWTLVA
nr:hypothetical protein [uncultured Kingella sp.]